MRVSIGDMILVLLFAQCLFLQALGTFLGVPVPV